MKLGAMGKCCEGIFWDEMLCDTSENNACWLNKYNSCFNAKKFVPVLELATITNYKQWG